MLKEKQKELEDKANMFKKQNEATERESKDALLFKTDLPPLHRKPSTAAKPRKQQAVVTPLQGRMWLISSLQSSWDTLYAWEPSIDISGLVFHDPLKIFPSLSLLYLWSCAVSMLYVSVVLQLLCSSGLKAFLLCSLSHPATVSFWDSRLNTELMCLKG